MCSSRRGSHKPDRINFYYLQKVDEDHDPRDFDRQKLGENSIRVSILSRGVQRHTMYYK